MPAPKPQLPAEPLCLIFGDEDFLVRERASQVFEGWCAGAGGEDHEIVNGTVRNATEALQALAKLNEAVQTLPFFGGAKVVWLRAANFLGDERTASSREVTDRLNGLAKVWETFDWQGVQVLISSGKVDKRKAFFKSAKKIAAVEDLSVADKERGSKAALVVGQRLAELGKKITSHVADELILLAGSNLQQLHTEADKLAAYVGGRDEVTRQDVHEIATRTKQAQAFALADALGERNLPKLLRVLDEELWVVKLDTKKSPIALLYGLISKVRTMIFLKEMLRLKWIRCRWWLSAIQVTTRGHPGRTAAGRPKIQPQGDAPVHALQCAWPRAALLGGGTNPTMDILLACNRQLVSSTDDTLLATGAANRQKGCVASASRSGFMR